MISGALPKSKRTKKMPVEEAREVLIENESSNHSFGSLNSLNSENWLGSIISPYSQIRNISLNLLRFRRKLIQSIYNY